MKMFEHLLVQQQLHDAIHEKNEIMQKFMQIQNDLTSIVKLMGSRLFEKFNISSAFFDPIKKNTESNQEDSAINKSEGSGSGDNFGESDAFAKEYQDVKVDKSLYQNSSGMPQIDTLAAELFKLFQNLSEFLSNSKMENDNIDLPREPLDKMGYMLSSGNYDFEVNKPVGDAIPESIKQNKKQQMLLKAHEMAKTLPNQQSLQMTSLLSNSRVRVSYNF